VATSSEGTARDEGENMYIEIREYIGNRTWREINLTPPDNLPSKNFWKYEEIENDYYNYPRVVDEDYMDPQSVGDFIRKTLKAIKQCQTPMILVINNKVIARNF